MILDLFFGPAQAEGAIGQLVLAVGGLAVMLDLGGGGLPNIDVSATLQMGRFDFFTGAHAWPPLYLAGFPERLPC